MNTVQILGNLGKEPEIRATGTGKTVASFSVAVKRKYTTQQGEDKELTDWINVVAWGSLAEAVGNQLKKGSRVFVEGRYSTRSYEDKSGNKRYVTEVIANMIAKPLEQGSFAKYGEVESDPIPF
jgi:single-strand DNA-binding protein